MAAITGADSHAITGLAQRRRSHSALPGNLARRDGGTGRRVFDRATVAAEYAEPAVAATEPE
jgi:hypothetical protein